MLLNIPPELWVPVMLTIANAYPLKALLRSARMPGLDATLRTGVESIQHGAKRVHPANSSAGLTQL